MNAHIKRIEVKIPAAEAGNINAQFELAQLYHNADHIEADPKAAFKWYSMAAETGHVGAQYFVGTMYASGEAVRQDNFRASEWYRLVSNLGRHADAQLALGDLYFKGQGVPHGYAEALSWYRSPPCWGIQSPSIASVLCMPRAMLGVLMPSKLTNGSPWP